MKYVAPLRDDEIQTLHDMHRYHPARRARMRAHSLLLSHQGFSIPHIARFYQVDRRSVSTWLDRWQTMGVVGLYDQPGSGRPPLLNDEEQQKVHAYLRQYPKDVKKVVQALEQETTKRVSTKTIKRLIKKTAMSGNGSGNHRPKRRIHTSTNAVKRSLVSSSSVKPLGTVIYGILMSLAFA
jgi:transposase